MPKSDLRLSDADYALVADRIVLFYQRFPSGRIITELVSRTDREITFRALVYRAVEETEPAATGWASEREGDGDVNAVACLENTETSAIGRALANLGFTAARQRASYEEMEKAARERARLARRPPQASGESTGKRVVRERPAMPPTPVEDGYAAALHDLLALLDRAEREGMTASRVAALRERLASRTLDLVGVERLERGVRHWLAQRSARRLEARATG